MRNRRRTGWLLGFAGSALVHVVALAALFAFGHGGWRGGEPGGDPARDTIIALGPVEPAFAGPDPLAAAIPVDVAPPARPSDAPEGDRDNVVPLSAAPSDSDGRRRQAPAPDRGDAGGRPPEHAFRLDGSTLRSRLTDHAATAQPPDTRTAGRLASPQAIRREPVVGIGDSVHSQTPRRVPAPTPTSAVAVAGPTGGQTGLPAEAPAASEAPLPLPSAELAALAVPDQARGPLDAE